MSSYKAMFATYVLFFQLSLSDAYMHKYGVIHRKSLIGVPLSYAAYTSLVLPLTMFYIIYMLFSI